MAKHTPIRGLGEYGPLNPDCEHEYESTPLVHRITIARLYRCTKCPAWEWR